MERAAGLSSTTGPPPHLPQDALAARQPEVAAPPAQLSPLPWRSAPTQPSPAVLDSRLSAFGLLMLLLPQLPALIGWRGLSGRQKLQNGAFVADVLAMAALPACAPKFYMRHRTWIILAFRVILFSLPLVHQPRVHLLGGEPRLGLRGAFRDACKLFWASRLLVSMGVSACNPLPLLPLVPHLLVQAYSVAATRPVVVPAMCASPLLSHPAMAQRIRAAHYCLFLVASLMPGWVHHAMLPLMAAADSPAAECESLGTLCFIGFGLLLPVGLLLKTESGASLSSWERKVQGLRAAPQAQPAAASDGGGDAAGGTDGSSSQGGRSGGGGGRLWARSEAALERAVRELYGRSWLAPGPRSSRLRAAGSDGAAWRRGCLFPAELTSWQRAAAWYFLLCALWVACVATS